VAERFPWRRGRTTSTLLAQLKCPELVRDRGILNHVPDKLASTYDQYEYLDEKREWLDKLAAKLVSLGLRIEAGDTISSAASTALPPQERGSDEREAISSTVREAAPSTVRAIDALPSWSGGYGYSAVSFNFSTAAIVA
jgi:hypothetical protein